MTVARLRAEMSAHEWMEWESYFARKAQLEDLEVEKAKS